MKLSQVIAELQKIRRQCGGDVTVTAGDEYGADDVVSTIQYVGGGPYAVTGGPEVWIGIPPGRRCSACNRGCD